MGRIVDGEIVLTEEETNRLLEIRIKERNRETSDEDRKLIFLARSVR
jgi:hypothetical protein